MSKKGKDYILFLEDILEAIEKIEKEFKKIRQQDTR